MPENGYIHEQLYTLYIQTELTENTVYTSVYMQIVCISMLLLLLVHMVSVSVSSLGRQSWHRRAYSTASVQPVLYLEGRGLYRSSHSVDVLLW